MFWRRNLTNQGGREGESTPEDRILLQYSVHVSFPGQCALSVPPSHGFTMEGRRRLKLLRRSGQCKVGVGGGLPRGRGEGYWFVRQKFF